MNAIIPGVSPAWLTESIVFDTVCLQPYCLWSYVTFPFCLMKSSWIKASLVAQMVMCLPAMLETWARSSDREDPLEKEMAIHSSTLAWKIPWTEEPGRLQSMGSQRVRHDWATSLSFFHELKPSMPAERVYLAWRVAGDLHLWDFISLDGMCVQHGIS